jgi:hypothetical protein
MRKLLKILGIAAFITVISFITVGCTTTTDLKTNLAGEYNLIPKIAGKDFVPLGLVSVSSTVVETVSPFRFTVTTEGERITFDMLLQEARRLYPDVSDIINVRIDRRNVSTKRWFLDFFTGTTTTSRYYGNALAVRYTNALEEVREPLEGRQGALPGGTSGANSGGGFLSNLPLIGGLFD